MSYVANSLNSYNSLNSHSGTGSTSALNGAISGAGQTLENSAGQALTMGAAAQGDKMLIDTKNSILAGRMDSETKLLNAGNTAAKAINF